MKFHQIKTAADIVPFIESNPQIRVKREDPWGYTVICYMLQDDETFAGEHEFIERECRGITFFPDGKIASRLLHKFFNVGEREDTQPHALPWARVVRIMDKRDGCCSADTILVTEDGEMTIKDICEKQYRGKVLAYRDGRQIMTAIIGHEIKENNDDWYEITLQNNQKIKLTGNHLVWVTNKAQYVRVDELTVEDEVLLK